MSIPSLVECRQLTFSEIEVATKKFDESLVIGHGGFGKVYKGTIVYGASLLITVAIKRLESNSNQGAPEFRAEIQMLSQLRDPQLVSLIGFCNDGQEMILVYEYMSNGTLADRLHKSGDHPLTWMARLEICLGAARGLEYLHMDMGIKPRVIHRDVKSSNILLDSSWSAKIADFGLSKAGPTSQPTSYVNTLVRGTFGYMDPDYFQTGKLTRKSDVYAFGVVMFEALCGKKALDTSIDEEHWGLAAWAQDSIKEGRLKQIVDSNLRGSVSSKCLKEFAQLANRCLHSHPKQRPTMTEVVAALESVLALHEKTNNHGLQPSGMTIFGKMVPSFLSTSSNPEKSDEGKQQSRNTVFTRKMPKSLGDDRFPIPNNLKAFTLYDLKTATKNFMRESLVGEGGFGLVYKGWVDETTFAPATPGTGLVVVVKVLESESHQGHREWLTEVDYLGKLRHKNLVKIIGYCEECENRLLVYEFLPKGNLENHLFRKGVEPISWATRMCIALDVAQGLSFLHSIQPSIVYGDLKASNILLDSEFTAVLSHFVLARYGPVGDNTHVSTRFVGNAGNVGYAAPEYVAIGHLTKKNDVYSFGVVLLELLSGRRAIADERVWRVEDFLVEWVRPFLVDNRGVFRIMDTQLGGRYSRKCAQDVAALALKCLHNDHRLRPTMAQVVASLEEITTNNAPKNVL